jgi:hypothetical protein
MPPVEQELKKVESVGTVSDGMIVGEYDFYAYLKAFEGRQIKWKIELAE